MAQAGIPPTPPTVGLNHTLDLCQRFCLMKTPQGQYLFYPNVNDKEKAGTPSTLVLLRELLEEGGGELPVPPEQNSGNELGSVAQGEFCILATSPTNMPKLSQSSRTSNYPDRETGTLPWLSAVILGEESWAEKVRAQLRTLLLE